MKSIVMFNNKGGVGKTTLLCNMASYLQIKHHKKVLVVDADPQCNATTYMFSDEEIEKIYDKKQTINKIIEPLMKGRGYISTDLPIITSPNFGIDIIPGDTKLSLSEDFLSKDWIDGKSGDFRGLQTTLVFKDLLIKVEKLKYDYVFFDVGPSLGALNRSVLVANDFYIVPMSSDIFSLQAIENISKSLSTWESQLNRGLSDYYENANEKFCIGDKEVKWSLIFVGYITQQYIAKTKNGVKQPVNAFEKIIRKIPQAISILESKNKSPLHISKLGEIPTLNSLIPLSQSSYVPIFSLKTEHGVVGSHFNKVKEYEQTISKIVNHLLKNIGDLND